MKTKPFKPLLWMSILILVVSLACLGGGSKPTATQPPAEKPATKAPPAEDTPTQVPLRPTKTLKPAEVPTDTEVPMDTEVPPSPTVAPSPTKSGAVTSLADVKKAVFQIEADGTFDYPEGTSFNEGGLGSGFIIDPSGIAVTNNHIVTGGAIYKIWVGGDHSKTYNAKVLGVSECSDLAVIKLDGSDFPYLEWHEGPINVGLKVYVAGFPLGDPNFTLTDGIVSKDKSDGNTSWSSVDYVLEHTAQALPGNSGGPLVDENGKVVGVHYASSQAGQHFAISAELAKPKTDQLRNGNIDSIGLNGDAFILPDSSFSGIWVYSVKSGSPADKSGVRGGDIITTIENFVLATDGTMKDYCDILQSHNASDTLGIEVYRYWTDELLDGQINGRELAVTASNVIGGGGGDVGGGTTTGGYDPNTGTYTEYTTVEDNTYTIQLDIPTDWSDINGDVWSSDWGGLAFDAPSISASADLNAYFDSYNESGVFFAASDRMGEIGGFVQLLDGIQGWYENDCNLDGRYDYGEGDFYDPYYEGKFDLWTKCGGTATEVMALVVRPKDNPTAFLIIVEVKLVKAGDLEALYKILDSFQVIGSF